MKRRNLYIPEDLWHRVQMAALKEGMERGAAVSVSEWIREAMEARLLLREKGGKM